MPVEKVLTLRLAACDSRTRSSASSPRFFGTPYSEQNRSRFSFAVPRS